MLAASRPSSVLQHIELPAHISYVHRSTARRKLDAYHLAGELGQVFLLDAQLLKKTPIFLSSLVLRVYLLLLNPTEPHRLAGELGQIRLFHPLLLEELPLPHLFKPPPLALRLGCTFAGERTS